MTGWLRSKFKDFRSQWSIGYSNWVCKYAIPFAVSNAIVSFYFHERITDGLWWSNANTDPPWQNSVTMQRFFIFSSLTTPKNNTKFGWWSFYRAFTSHLYSYNAFSRFNVSPNINRFMATSVPLKVALYTFALPPDPISLSTYKSFSEMNKWGSKMIFDYFFSSSFFLLISISLIFRIHSTNSLSWSIIYLAHSSISHSLLWSRCSEALAIILIQSFSSSSIFHCSLMIFISSETGAYASLSPFTFLTC